MDVEGYGIFQIVSKLKHLKKLLKQEHGKYFRGAIDRVQQLYQRLIHIQDSLPLELLSVNLHYMEQEAQLEVY